MSITAPPVKADSQVHWIRVRGANVHNLKHLDVDIPQDRLVVLTGVSGSGKSSLAFDTLFAEGQRRYLESLSTYTRQFLDQLEPPDVELLEGLPPTLSIEQRVGSVQPRSTVATTTEISDYLRVLYARAGTPHCVECGTAISQQSPQAIVDRILELEAGRKTILLAPVIRGRKGAHADVFATITQAGFVRARVDGEMIDVTEPPKLAKSKLHTIEIVVDRVIIKEGIRSRLMESVAVALKHGEGTCIVSHETDSGWEDRLFSSRFACPKCGASIPEIEPRTFSFNSPYGACPKCEGLGVVPDKTRKTENGATVPCPECGGSRLGPVARAVTIADMPIHRLAALTIDQAAEFVERLRGSLAPDSTDAIFSPQARMVAARTLPDVGARLRYLQQVGLAYLTLDRSTNSLSGGEFQRTRLASCLGSGLLGVCYILDEPTIGLHPRDTGRLWNTLRELRDQGNSVLIVEHDLDFIRRADFIVDLGPGAGTEGGRIVAAGSADEVAQCPESLTGGFLSGRLTLESDRKKRAVDPARSLKLEHARLHNLRDVTAVFPLGVLVCVTGVSGSGKSSLVVEGLIPQLRAALAGETIPPGESGTLHGADQIQRLVEIDQSPLGRTGRSNPATFSGMWDFLRKIFAQTREAKLRGYTSRRFSFNAPDGRCPICKGQGTRRLEMNFLPDLHVICPACHGSRFEPNTLEIRFRGKSIADVLEMRIDEAMHFFDGFARLSAMLTTFHDVGLGYLSLGQSALTLSGGEAQRVKLATELGQVHQRGTLFVLDEPTTGLHLADIRKLLFILQRLVDQGNSVLVIEHQLDVIRAADWIIDLGPEGGAGGGRIVAAGPPEEIAAVNESHTGRALRESRPPH